MCGVVGAIAKNVDLETVFNVKAILASQFSRGPDYQSIEEINTKQACLLLGHNRLSIIDLTTDANQPMWDIMGRYCIVYNGEIYNYLELRAELIQLGHQFHSHSDTEVILNAFSQWGIESLKYFNGPFAFALFDKQTEQLWLCRDRFGVKPLYYGWFDDRLYFASTTNELAKKFRLLPNLNYVAKGLKYLIYEDNTDTTAYNGLQSLLPGHYLLIKPEKNFFNQQLVKYYDLTSRVNQLQLTLLDLSIPQLGELLLERLQEAVSMRLRSDVTVGVSLSGGLDSSSVASLVAEQNQTITGFTFGNPKVSKSEGPLVDQLAKYCNINVHYIWPNAHQIINGLFKTLKVQDAPFASLSIVMQYLVYQSARDQSVKVLLGGQGGDEGFMGYRKFQLFWLKQLFQKRNYFETLSFCLQLLPMFAAEFKQIQLYVAHFNRYRSNQGLKTNLLLPEIGSPMQTSCFNDDIRLRQLEDITTCSLPTLLRYEDRNSMGNSVESRLPFMDYQVVELGLALPTIVKLRHGYGKWLVRNIMKNKIPDVIRTARYKRGFDIPLSQLLTAGLGKMLRENLQDNYSNFREYLPSHIKLDEIFSDYQLQKRPAAIAEAISLLWLSGGYR